MSRLNQVQSLRPPAFLAHGRSLVAESWARSAAAGVDPARAELHRVSPDELRERQERSAQLLRVATIHVEWLSRSISAISHLVYVTDADGIILYSTGTAPEMLAQLGLAPGFDWSERRMGTNGAGTALATGEPVAIAGDEHFVKAFRHTLCTAAPIRDARGQIIGALDISTGLDGGSAERLLLAAHVAYIIEQQLAISEAGAEKPRATPRPRAASHPAVILNVDDHEVPRYVRSRVLRAAGYDVIEATCAEDALRVLEEKPVDLALVDVWLPDVNGLQLARQIREDERTPDVMVVNVSAAYVDPSDRAHALEEGAHAYLAEPIDPRELVATVGSLLRAQAAERGRRTAISRLETQYAIARLITESTTLAEAVPAMLQRFCEGTGWDAGECWIVNHEGTSLTLLADWHRHDASREFAALSRQMTFVRGEALPGHVWEEAQPTWIPDVTADRRVWRARQADAAGFTTVFGCPIVVSGEVSAVVLFFSTQRKDADEDLVQMVGSVTRLLAQSLERERFLDVVRAKEARIRAQLAEIEAIYRSAPVGLCVLDRDLRYVRINEQLAAINGVAAADHIGRTLREVLPQFGEAVEPQMRAVIETGEPRLDVELSGETPALPGELRHWVEQWLPIKDHDGRVVGLNIVAEEVTERRRAEELRQRLLLDAQAARAEAEASNREKDKFLAVLSHELRTPLSTLAVALTLLERGPGEGEREKALRTANRQWDQLRRLVDDLLDASRITRGAISLEKQELDLRAMIVEMRDTFSGLSDGTEVSIEVKADEPLPVYADRSRVTQILSNLIGNAVKYTPQGGRVTIAGCCEEGYAVVRIADTGQGIPAEVLPRIFELFVQAVPGSTGGMGIGLAIARTLAEMHGGSLVARSEGIDCGSEFELRLPLAH